MCIKCVLARSLNAQPIREFTLEELRPESIRIAYESMLEPTQVKDHELYELQLIMPNGAHQYMH